MNRLEEIKNALSVGYELDKEEILYLLNEVERYKNGLKEISRYTHPDYPFKGETLISEINTLINLALKEE